MLSAVDAAMTDLMRAVLHDPAFQQVEAAWRGVQWLVSTLDLGETLELHLLHVTRDELAQAAAQDGDLWRRLVEHESRPEGGLEPLRADRQLHVRPVGRRPRGCSSSWARWPPRSERRSSPAHRQPPRRHQSRLAAAAPQLVAAGARGRDAVAGIPRACGRRAHRPGVAAVPVAAAVRPAKPTRSPPSRSRSSRLPRPRVVPLGKRVRSPTPSSWPGRSTPTAMRRRSRRSKACRRSCSRPTTGRSLQPPAEINISDAAVVAIQARGIMPLISLKDRDAIRLVLPHSIANPSATCSRESRPAV